MTDSQSQISKPLCAAYICYIDTRSEYLFSLDAQLRQIQACAASEGIELVRIYTDLATRACKQKYRPGIVKLLADAKKGRFTRLYVYWIDSLAQRLEWSLEIVKELETLGVTLRGLVAPPDPEIYRTRCGFLHRMVAGSRKANLPPPLEITPPPFDRLHSGIRLAAQRVPKAGSHQPEAAIKARQR